MDLATTTLLVLLVGDLSTPFQRDLREALPQAFPEGVPEVGLGLSAPPGRTVAWVTGRSGGQEIEVTLHTARIPGDLRRVLRFTAEDGGREKARATAFTLAAMVRERDADLRALEPRPPPPAPLPSSAPRRWWLDGSLLLGLNLPQGHLGGGGLVSLRRELTGWLLLGVGAEVSFFGTPAASLVHPALFAELALPLRSGTFSVAAVVGGGVAAPVLVRGTRNVTTWLPLLRLAVEGRLFLGERHGLRFALASQLVSSSLSVQVGETAAGGVGPAFVRPEFGYFGEL